MKRLEMVEVEMKMEVEVEVEVEMEGVTHQTVSSTIITPPCSQPLSAR